MKDSSKNVILGTSCHGKERVRVAKVVRHESGVHDILELSIKLELIGGTDESFTDGDNRGVVATDTCRNHVYMHAKHNDFQTAEQFAIGLSQRLLGLYSHVQSVNITVEEKPWRRAVINAAHHRHGFINNNGNGIRSCRLEANRELLSLSSVISELSVLKTTMSGWENFVQDKFTTLPETNERILATTISAQWTYRQKSVVELQQFNFMHIYEQVIEALLLTFFGSPHEGIYSPGVQHTLYNMGNAVLQKIPYITTITLSLPNLHFLPCDLPVFRKNDVRFEHDVYIPTDDPHGIITATVSQKPLSKL